MAESKLLPKSTTWKYRYSMALIDAEIECNYYRDGKINTYSWIMRHEGKIVDYGYAASHEESKAALAKAVKEFLGGFAQREKGRANDGSI